MAEQDNNVAEVLRQRCPSVVDVAGTTRRRRGISAATERRAAPGKEEDVEDNGLGNTASDLAEITGKAARPCCSFFCCCPGVCVCLLTAFVLALANVELWNIENLWQLDGPCVDFPVRHAKTLALRALHVVYHPRYNIQFLGVEMLHRFDTTKHEKIAASLRGKSDVHITRPCRPLDHGELLEVHEAEHLALRRSSERIASITNLPPLALLPAWLLDRYLLRAHRYQAAGTLLAAQLALHGASSAAVNLGGGFHHAHQKGGSGFCFYSDIALTMRRLLDAGLVTHAWVIDLDFHQGNGISRSIASAQASSRPLHLSLVDVFCGLSFPFDFEAERHAHVQVDTCKLAGDSQNQNRDRVQVVAQIYQGLGNRITLKKIHDDHSYLNLVARILTRAKAKLPTPDLVFYNAGSDVLGDDPLNWGMVNLTADGIQQRDAYVFDFAQNNLKVPVVMTLSGGYGQSSATAIQGSLRYLSSKVVAW